MKGKLRNKVRNKVRNCETPKRYLFSRFNAVKHGGYAGRDFFHALATNERLQQRMRKEEFNDEH